jgi:hypothetical protein
LIEGELTIRSASLPSVREGKIQDVFLFGTYDEIDGQGRMQRPRDPMAELVLTLGDPAVLAEKCNRRAGMFALLSAVGVFSALTLNLAVLLLVWHLIIR